MVDTAYQPMSVVMTETLCARSPASGGAGPGSEAALELRVTATPRSLDRRALPTPVLFDH